MTQNKFAQKSIDPATQTMLSRAEQEGIETAWNRLESQDPQCGFGLLGLCCRNCNMGPCRIDPFGNGPERGVCGATADTIVSRNLLRAIAAGAAAHSDHGRDIVEALLHAAKGDAPDYEIKDKEKLLSLARELNVPSEERSEKEIAADIAYKALDEFGTRKGNLDFVGRVPAQRKNRWSEAGILPGIDRNRRDYAPHPHRRIRTINDLQGLRAALSDGGAVPCGPELSDVLFYTTPQRRATLAF